MLSCGTVLCKNPKCMKVSSKTLDTSNSQQTLLSSNGADVSQEGIVVEQKTGAEAIIQSAPAVKLTKKEKKLGFVWKCPVCNRLSKYEESICETCMGEDA